MLAVGPGFENRRLTSIEGGWVSDFAVLDVGSTTNRRTPVLSDDDKSRDDIHFCAEKARASGT